jgi:ABC-type uncharacterized transport system permease subunit
MALANSLAFILYLASSAILIRRFVQRDNSNTLASLPIGIVTVLALLFHAAGVFFIMQQAGGWDVGLLTTGTIIAWVMALVAFIIGFKTPNAHPGIIVYPLVALSIILKTELPTDTIQPLSDPALEWHVLLSLSAYSLFALAALQAVVLAIQEKQLRQRHLSGIIRKLPPLQTMESTLFQLLTTGFILLAIGLITGLMFLEDMLAQQVAHKTILSFIAWLVFAGLLWGRWRYGWRGRTAIKWTITGFIFLALAFVGSKIILEYLLQ